MKFPAHRYPFSEIGKGIFFFVTDLGIYYTVQISNVANKVQGDSLLFNDGHVYEISFIKTGEEKAFDQSVFETIMDIVVANYLAKGDLSVFSFVCDTTDERGKFRARLFDTWFSKAYNQYHGLAKVDFKVPGYEGNEYDVSLLISTRHPHFREYISDFGKLLKNEYSKVS